MRPDNAQMPQYHRQTETKPARKLSPSMTASANAILDAAEELFCSKGFSAVTMREIAATSGQHLSLANYYFGSKIGLFEAAFLRRIVPVNKRRIALVQEFRDAGRCDLGDVVEAYLRPLFEVGPGDSGKTARLIMLFSKQLLSNPGEHSYLLEYYEETSQVFIDAICSARPNLDVASAVWSYAYMVGILVFTLAGQETVARIPADLMRRVPPDESHEQTIRRLRGFICAGIDGMA
jgi:AcrR family transcriptional regulator